MIDGNTVTDEMRFFLGKFKQKLYIYLRERNFCGITYYSDVLRILGKKGRKWLLR